MNPILIGQAQEIDPVQPQVRRMLAEPGIWIGGDSLKAEMTVPLAVIDGKVYSMVLDNELDPERFLGTLTLHGPYNADQKVFDLVSHLRRQAAFSERTFGPGSRVEGVTDHIAKELREVRESGGALAEWVDVIILGLDGAWRSGATPEQIADAIEAKQTKNEGRTWPDWRTAPADKAIEHDRSKDAPQAPSFQDRVRAEYDELNGRLSKLVAFFSTDTFAGLGRAEQDLLQAQHAAMCDYSNCLSERIYAFQAQEATQC